MPDYKTRDDLARELRLSQAKQKDAEDRLAKAQAATLPSSVITVEDLTRILLGAGDAPLDPVELLTRLGVKVPISFSVTINFTVTGKDIRLVQDDVERWDMVDGLIIPASDRVADRITYSDFNVVVVNPIDPPDPSEVDPVPQEPKPTPSEQHGYPAKAKSVGEQWKDIEAGR